MESLSQDLTSPPAPSLKTRATEMIKMTDKNVTFNIDDGGEAFFTHELGTHFTPLQFCLDFKNISPRLDQRTQEGGAIFLIKHNVIIADPWLTKQIAGVLNDSISKYEKMFGKIEKPEALDKFEKSMKKNNIHTENPSYFG